MRALAFAGALAGTQASGASATDLRDAADSSMPILERTRPTFIAYRNARDIYPDGDFASMKFSGNAFLINVAVVGIDLAFDQPASSTSGCQASDFDDVQIAGKIALLQRGGCSFHVKAVNAAGAGAAGIVVFNQGDTPQRKGIFLGTLESLLDAGFPAVTTTFEVGRQLAVPGAAINLVVDALAEHRQTRRLVALSP